MRMFSSSGVIANNEHSVCTLNNVLDSDKKPFIVKSDVRRQQSMEYWRKLMRHFTKYRQKILPDITYRMIIDFEEFKGKEFLSDY